MQTEKDLLEYDSTDMRLWVLEKRFRRLDTRMNDIEQSLDEVKVEIKDIRKQMSKAMINIAIAILVSNVIAFYF
jgi:intergrase/recombinase